MTLKIHASVVCIIYKCILASLSQVLRFPTSFLTKQRYFNFFYSLILRHTIVKNVFIAYSLGPSFINCAQTKIKIKKEKF